MIDANSYIIIKAVMKVIKEIKNIKNFYRTLGGKTRFVIRSSLTAVVTLILTAIYAYTAVDNPFHYELLLICDDLLELAKSITAVGFLSALLFGYLEKKPQGTQNE